MTERDDHLAEGFLVEGVAPPVIGGEANPGPVAAGGTGGFGNDFRDDYDDIDYDPRASREPPTTPIPAQSLAQGPGRDAAQSRPEQRKGWLGRVFGRG